MDVRVCMQAGVVVKCVEGVLCMDAWRTEYTSKDGQPTRHYDQENKNKAKT